MNIQVDRKDYNILIKNFKLFSREEQEKIIERYKGEGPKNAPNGPNLRKHLEIASLYDNRTIITYDIIVSTKSKTIKSNFAIIISYDESIIPMYDIHDSLTKSQDDEIWKLRGEIIGLFSQSISRLNREFVKDAEIISDKNYKNDVFMRNGKEVFLCLIRDILTPATFEERIRQKVLLSLLKDSQIPKEFIKVEENLSHYNKNVKDRADIIILHPETEKPFILYEIKAPDVYISDDTLDQSIRYNRHLNCRYICLYNSLEEKWYISDKGSLKELSTPKSIKELLSGEIEYLQKNSYQRPTLIQCSDEIIIKKHMYGKSAIGEKTPRFLHKFIVNLYGFLRVDKSYITNPLNCDDFAIIKDGIRKTSFSNASGGEYNGVYRYFILEFPNKENNIVSISIFGTNSETTILLVAIDDFENRHSSLQLNFDKNITENNSYWEISHQGTLVAGKKGTQKKSKLLSFYKKLLPDLVKDNRILLGRLPKDQLFNWDNTKALIINIMRYALVRDMYRNSKK